MNIKKEIIDRIEKALMVEYRTISGKIWDNKRMMKQLVEEQTVMKREKSKIFLLIRDLKRQ